MEMIQNGFPEQIAERGGIASIRLALLPFVWLDEDYLVASIVFEHSYQPIIETTNFENCTNDSPFCSRQRVSS